MNNNSFFNRRLFLKTSLLGGVVSLFAKNVSALSPISATPAQTEGPFYPITPQKDKDFDLTQIKGGNGIARGRIIYIVGQVVDTHSNPIENATVDIWQANAAGKYNHPHDDNSAALDDNFQGWAIVQSGVNGSFKFKTILPGAYPSSPWSMRPPHIHFKVSKAEYIELTTQMYFPNNELNDKDRILNRHSAQERQLLIATQISDSPETYQYKIVIESV